MSSIFFGYLVVDPGRFLHQSQATELADRIQRYKGWPHPDGCRWILPVEAPTYIRDKLIASGWPEDAVTIAV